MERTTHKIIYWVLGGLLAASVIFAGFQYTRAETMKVNVENGYNRAFHELVDYVDDIETLLEKSMLVSSPAQMSKISSELFREATAAKECLSQLPVTEANLEKTQKFLSQVGDYTYVLSQKLINEEEVSEEEYKNLSALGDFAKVLNEELLVLQDNIYSGRMSFSKLKNETNNSLSSVAKAADGDILSGFQNVEKEFQELPSLIYDGPFSEHIEKINPVMTENQRTLTETESLEKAKAFLPSEGVNLVPDGESQNTALESYLFRGGDDTKSVYAAFTKKGGYPVYFLINREIGEENITVENAIIRARGFLYDHGFSSMKDCYYDKAGGIATINFAYQQGDVICYSDLIKVKVALDDGEVIGFESNGYLMSHKTRDFSAPKITMEEAKSKVNGHLEVESSQLALIPKDSKREVLCYEFRGKYNERNFLIYINAENGREEQILMLIESEAGILTV